MVARGAHVNAAGAITQSAESLLRIYFRAQRSFAVDTLPATRALSAEFIDWYDSQGKGDWTSVQRISDIVAAQRPRPTHTDLSLFKPMGMGISDVALGIEIIQRAESIRNGPHDPPSGARYASYFQHFETGDCSMTQAIIRDISGEVAPPSLDLWEPVIITGEQISAEAQRLASLARPANGRRESMFVHPRASAPGNGLAPGIRVVLSVLKPGEETAPIRHNSTQVNFCIRGSGSANVGDTRVRYRQYDVWNTPSFRTYTHRNDGDDLQVRLTYSNAPVLEMLNIHIVEERPVAAELKASKEDEQREDPRRKSSVWHGHARERLAADAI